MAAFVGAIPTPTQNSRTGSQSNGLTSNMVALRRYHRKAYWHGLGSQTLTGSVTSSTSSTAVTGVGTRFTSEMRIGDKLMKADGVTLIGYVGAIASDTALTLLSNAAAAQSAAAATTVPRVAFLSTGDSVANLKNQFVVPLLWRMLGSRGFCGHSGAGLGGTTGLASTGTAVQLDGTSGKAYDYSYNPMGVHLALGAASSYTWGVGGATFSGNLFTAYLLQGPGQGTVTVDLLDGANVVQSTQNGIDLGTGFATYSLRVVKFALGAAAARKIRVTTTAGTAIVPFEPSMENTNVKGVHLASLFRGGLALTDILSCPNPQLVAAWIADQQPDLATYEMREGGGAYVAANLPGVVARYMATWSATDWIFYGCTPGSSDAGLPKASAPSWAECEATRAFALASGYAYFDGYTPCESYETLQALDPYDGQHVGAMTSARLASLAIRQLGLDAFVNLPLAPSTIAAATARAGKVSINRDPAGVLTDSAYLETDTFLFDLYVRLQRWMAVTDQGGTNRAMFVSPNAAQGLGVIFSGRNGGAGVMTNGGYYNPQDWAILVDTAGIVTLRGKDGSGTFKSLALGTLS